MRKRLVVIAEVFLFAILMISMSAMDSPNIAIPSIGMLSSLIGLLVMSAWEGCR